MILLTLNERFRPGYIGIMDTYRGIIYRVNMKDVTYSKMINFSIGYIIPIGYVNLLELKLSKLKIK